MPAVSRCCGGSVQHRSIPGKHVLTDYTVYMSPTWQQHELNHTDHTHTSDHTDHADPTDHTDPADHTDPTDQEYIFPEISTADHE